MTLKIPLPLETQMVERVWGGQHLAKSKTSIPIGEAWVVAEHNRVSSGPHAGKTVAELTAQYPQEMLGTHGTSKRFPLLIKLLDCADWLSVQVHPNDQQAHELEGEGELGKTEAWHILQAGAGAQVINGIRAGTSPQELRTGILAGKVMEYIQYSPVHASDTIMVPAGTIHALGPSILLYEVQQSSDTTYRIYDWDRPQAAGRKLHLEQSATVSRPVSAEVQALPAPSQEGITKLTQSPYFLLEKLGSKIESKGKSLALDTQGQSFHILTVTQGQAKIDVLGEQYQLNQFESLLIPASVGAYLLSGVFEVLRSRLP